MQPITMQEVEVAVNKMVEGKALVLEKFTINFFHHYWDLLKMKVLDLIEESWKNQWFLPALNATYFTNSEGNRIFPSK